jgi:hypothetical protein
MSRGNVARVEGLKWEDRFIELVSDKQSSVYAAYVAQVLGGRNPLRVVAVKGEVISDKPDVIVTAFFETGDHCSVWSIKSSETGVGGRQLLCSSVVKVLEALPACHSPHTARAINKFLGKGFKPRFLFNELDFSEKLLFRKYCESNGRALCEFVVKGNGPIKPDYIIFFCNSDPDCFSFSTTDFFIDHLYSDGLFKCSPRGGNVNPSLGELGFQRKGAGSDSWQFKTKGGMLDWWHKRPVVLPSHDGFALRSERLFNGLSHVDLSVKTGLSDSYLARLEKRAKISAGDYQLFLSGLDSAADWESPANNIVLHIPPLLRQELQNLVDTNSLNIKDLMVLLDNHDFKSHRRKWAEKYSELHSEYITFTLTHLQKRIFFDRSIETDLSETKVIKHALMSLVN